MKIQQTSLFHVISIQRFQDTVMFGCVRIKVNIVICMVIIVTFRSRFRSIVLVYLMCQIGISVIYNSGCFTGFERAFHS